MLLAGIMLQVSVSEAQVTTSNTPSGLGTKVTLSPAGTTYTITGGTRPGNGPNLFHSFVLFNLPSSGDVANFNNETGRPTSNILGRVTGGQTSSIFGTIQTTNFGAANLFLINPAGWIFGPTAALKVGGSFHVSTADYIRFSDEAQFYADLSKNGILTSAPPAAFGFLGSPLCLSPCISVNGSLLQVPDGKSLSLVGGNVQITGAATLLAPGGRVQIASFASKGEATIDGLDGSFASLGRVEVSGGSSVSAVGAVGADSDGNPIVSNGGTVLIRGGQIDILGLAVLKASGGQALDSDGNPLAGAAGGTVVIRGGRLLVDSSSILADTFGTVNGAPVGIDIQMTDSVELTTATTMGTSTSGVGRGGDIRVTADQVSVDGSIVSTSTSGDGRAGDLSIENVARLSLTGFAEISSLNLSFGSGRAGNVTVTATELIDISGGSKLSNTTFFNGNGGQLTITAPSLRLAGEGTGIITSTTDIFGGGIPGNVAIDVGELSVIDGAQLATFASTVEHGGNLTVKADSGLISGRDAGGFPSGIYSSNAGGGPAGDISLNIARLRLTSGAVIESGNITDPQGGDVTISANESIVISDGSGITLRAFSQDVGQLAISSAGSLTIDNGFVSTSTTEAGQAGDIAVKAHTLSLLRGGQITSSSEAFASGGGGNVTINADSVSISGSSPSGTPSSPFSTDPRSGVFSTTAGSGSGGTIAMSAPSLTLTDRGTISAATSGSGSAGNINITVQAIEVANGATISASTTEAGQAGDIAVKAHTLSLLRGGQITSNSEAFASGGGGNVMINADLVSISGSSPSGLPSSPFSTDPRSGVFSTTAGSGPGGTIAMSAPSLTLSDSGTISAATSGSGSAGNINITVQAIEVANGATISATSTGTAEALAGNINITFGDSLRLQNSSLTTSSNAADGGSIVITSTGSLLYLLDSQITTSVRSGVGSGGNITIGSEAHPVDFVVLNGSQIRADAFGGPGGNIRIFADTFLTSESCG